MKKIVVIIAVSLCLGLFSIIGVSNGSEVSKNRGLVASADTVSFTSPTALSTCSSTLEGSSKEKNNKKEEKKKVEETQATISTTIPTTIVEPATNEVDSSDYENNYKISYEEEENDSNGNLESNCIYSGNEFRNSGVIYWNSYRWTYYSERILSGEGLNIPSRHSDSQGYICDGDNYICLASSTLEKGTIVPTPFGKSGKIYDCGCASGTIDVYVNW